MLKKNDDNVYILRPFSTFDHAWKPTTDVRRKHSIAYLIDQVKVPTL
jgi:hypothetical protein